MKPKIIGIGGISAAGKSTLCQALGKALDATVILWDDYEKISTEPENYFEWFQTNRDYNVWKYDALANVLKTLKAGTSTKCPITNEQLNPTKYVIFEAPLARSHYPTGQYIDYLIFLDTPSDIALARRMLREFKQNIDDREIKKELENYLAFERPIYLFSHEANHQADLIINGSLPLADQVNSILNTFSQNIFK